MTAPIEPTDARILIVDDEPANLALLQTGYHNLLMLSDSSRVIDWIKDWDPHLVLLDLHMPKVDGMTVLIHIRTHLNLQVQPGPTG